MPCEYDRPRDELRLRSGVCGASAICAVAVLAAAFAPGRAAADGRDDTAWLQARLDGGGRVYLPRLPEGECYRTRGLWVTRSGTRIASNGACIVYLGSGPVRLASSDGDPIAANAIFVVNRSSASARPPRHVAISDLTLIVPIGTDGYGLVVAGNDVALVHLDVEGVPLDGITVTGRNNGLGYAGPVMIRDSLVRGAQRNGISVVGAVSVTIDSNVITGVGLIGMTNPELGPWAGIDVEPDQASYPIKRVAIRRNTISGNAGAGVMLALVTSSGWPGVADQITLSGNSITRNGVLSGGYLRGGVCLQGGQSDRHGSLSLIGNEIAGNGGWGLCSDGVWDLRVTLMCNLIHDNADGDDQWGALSSTPPGKADGTPQTTAGCS